MKNKLLSITLSLIMMMTVATVAVSAETAAVADRIRTLDQLKAELSSDMEDGVISETEKRNLMNRTSESAKTQLLTEKLDKVTRLFQTGELPEEISNLSKGDVHQVRYYDLGDGCQLIVELKDQPENTLIRTGISPLTVSGSSEIWKAYGNRYFTAKATVKCNVVTVSFILENHYILSADGIDENYGKALASCDESRIAVGYEKPIITDGSARTRGASDVNMYSRFSYKTANSAATYYKLNSTVKYLSHDKTGKQIKVGQVWSLEKL